MTFSFSWMQWMLINKILLIKYLRAWDWSCSKLDGLTSSQCSRSGLKSVWIFCQKVFNPGYWSQEWLHCLDQGDFEPPKKHLSPTYPFLNNSAPKIWLWHCYLLKKHPLDPKDLLLFKKLLQSNTTGGASKPPKAMLIFLKKTDFYPKCCWVFVFQLWNSSSKAPAPGQVRLVWLWGLQRQQWEYQGRKLHLIWFKFTEVSVFWDIFLLYIFVNVKCSRHQTCWIFKWKLILLSPPPPSQTKNKAAFASPRFPSSPTPQHPSWKKKRKSKSRKNTRKYGFFFVKKMCQKIPAFLPRSHCGFGWKDTKLLRQGTFISSVKSQPLKVALRNFILKAG